MTFELFNKFSAQIKRLDFGTKFVFTPNLFPTIPKEIANEDIVITNSNRFVTNGLKDFLIADISKYDSIALGLWILSCYFQQKQDKYILKLLNENSVIKEIWIDFRGDKFFQIDSNTSYFIDNRSAQTSLDKFIWSTDKVEHFVANSKFYFNQKIFMGLTNEKEDWINMDEFYSRDIMVGFGDIGGGLLAAEFFLNLGLEKSDVNYEHLSHDFYRSLNSKDSCDFRAEVYHQSPNIEDKIVSENN